MLRDLREKVRQIWVRGFLESSLHSKTLIALGKEAMPDAVDHPWGRVLELPDGTLHSIDPKTSALRLYEDASRMLLVLGEPGSGKTTTLLELARDLIAEATQDESKPVPVVLNLATWGQAEIEIGEWIASELAGKYGSPRKLARQWLEDGELVLLLDGLDEVEAGRRTACVGAINEYLTAVGVPGMCLCSRFQEYAALEAKVSLSGAIRLEPLNDVQIYEYVEKIGEKLAGFREVLRTDAEIREVARSPLMLSIMSLAYEGASIEEVALPFLATAQARREHAFRTYVRKMFKRRGHAVQAYTARETIGWLHCLARGMKERSQTVFLVEELQPDWLPNPAWHAAYALVSRTIVGIVWLGGPVIFSTSLKGMPIAVSLGLSVGLVDAIRFTLRPTSNVKHMSTLSRLLRVAFYSTVSSTATIFAFIYRNDLQSWSLTLSYIFFGPFGIIYGLRSSPLGATRDIHTNTTLHWSRKRSEIGFKWTAFPASIFASLSWLIYIVSREGIPKITSNFAGYVIGNLFVASTIGSLFGFIAGAIGAAVGGFTVHELDAKSRPNNGILFHIRRSISYLIATEIVTVSIAMAFDPDRWSSIKDHFKYSLVVATLVALASGGIDVIQHFLLRVMLRGKGIAPWRLARFLDHCATLIFLQRVGGGYVFVHRLLLEYFAEDPNGRDV